jgi:hypothetical protein
MNPWKEFERIRVLYRLPLICRDPRRQQWTTEGSAFDGQTQAQGVAAILAAASMLAGRRNLLDRRAVRSELMVDIQGRFTAMNDNVQQFVAPIDVEY